MQFIEKNIGKHKKTKKSQEISKLGWHKFYKGSQMYPRFWSSSCAARSSSWACATRRRALRSWDFDGHGFCMIFAEGKMQNSPSFQHHSTIFHLLCRKNTLVSSSFCVETWMTPFPLCWDQSSSVEPLGIPVARLGNGARALQSRWGAAISRKVHTTCESLPSRAAVWGGLGWMRYEMIEIGAPWTLPFQWSFKTGKK